MMLTRTAPLRWRDAAALALVTAFAAAVLWVGHRAIEREDIATRASAEATARAAIAKMGRDLDTILEEDIAGGASADACPIFRSFGPAADAKLARPAVKDSPDCQDEVRAVTFRDFDPARARALAARCPLARTQSGRRYAATVFATLRDDAALVGWWREHLTALDESDLDALEGSLLAAKVPFAEFEAARSRQANSPLTEEWVALLATRPRVELRTHDLSGRAIMTATGPRAFVARASTLEACARHRLTLPNAVVLHVERGAQPETALRFSLAPNLHLRLEVDANAVAFETARNRTLLRVLSALIAATCVAWVAVFLWQGARDRRLAELRVDFVAAISHELRTPVASLQVLTELFARGELSEGESETALASMTSEVTRMRRTIDRMLEFRRLAAGGAVARKMTDVTAWIAGFVRDEVDSPVECTGFGPQDAPLHAEVDTDRLAMALHALLDNAKKHAAGAAVELTLRATAAKLYIAVRDHGPGVAKDDLERIFAPFERSRERLSEATSGSGIGLAVVRFVARAHRGDAKAEQASPGLRVLLELPRSPTLTQPSTHEEATWRRFC
jgi:two-component system phosphate regulon sensor histidine kinase PhoR